MTAPATHDAPPFHYSAAARDEVLGLTKKYPEGRGKSALIRALHIAQEENDGWLSVPAMDEVAATLRITPIEVYEVASFYSMFNLAPVGKYVLEFCQTGPCMIEGADRIIEYTKLKLGIGKNQTTPDGMFTIKQVECLGACGYAPMMQVGEFYHEHLDEAKIDRFIEDCRAGKINKGTWKMH
ncbi:MAG TPA: NAD(P)H-dependent oxidoreductase subunit E [Saprospiraceae bacterium]|nr:NAD(P)H-dependent oxidoreductase subunit E [Saprospiraceae bacterium]HND88348.1 NAD(P)H-dependent oxidoreductase subunit E [Saprospiraceae bacterium]